MKTYSSKLKMDCSHCHKLIRLRSGKKTTVEVRDGRVVNVFCSHECADEYKRLHNQ